MHTATRTTRRPARGPASGSVRRSLAGVLAAGLVGTAAVLGAAPAAAQTSAGVTLTGDNTFSPEDVTVDEGGTVTFTWDGGTHNVSFDDGPMSETTGEVGTTFSRTFDEAGTFDFVCTIHPTTMSGTVTVEAASTPDPPATDDIDDTADADDTGDVGGTDDAQAAPPAATPRSVPAGTDGQQAAVPAWVTLAVVLGLLGLAVPTAVVVGRRR